MSEPVSCNGMCVMASELIEGMTGVAFPRDECPMHSPLAVDDVEDHSEDEPRPCPSTAVSVLGMVGGPAEVRCGLLEGHEGSHRMSIEWWHA